MSEFTQSEESKKRMEDLSQQVEVPHFAKSLSERAGHIASWKDGYLAGMSDPEANSGLLDEVESLVERIIFNHKEQNTGPLSILDFESVLQKLRERGKG